VSRDVAGTGVSWGRHAKEAEMAVKLYRCSVQRSKHKRHPCWVIEKALIDAGIEYERVPGPVRKSKRDVIVAATGQRRYPAIQLENGTWYREESSEMARAIAEGRLMEKAGS
jgi:hypothetical protein